MDVPIHESIDLSEIYPSVVDRYFTRQYFTNNQDDNDMCLLFHSNKICVVTLAPTHNILKRKLAVKNVNFKIGEELDRSENIVKGKGKKGAQNVNANSVLCIVKCEDGTEYRIKACVRGKLIEVNENLVTNPQLLVDKPETEGYIAVVLQRLGDKSNQELGYKTEKDYAKYCELSNE